MKLASPALASMINEIPTLSSLFEKYLEQPDMTVNEMEDMIVEEIIEGI